VTGFRWEFECKNRESRPDGIFGKDNAKIISGARRTVIADWATHSRQGDLEPDLLGSFGGAVPSANPGVDRSN
jgi:hypothetical protein